MIQTCQLHKVTHHALSHGDVVVLAELDEEVQHVEGGGGGEGLQALEALEAHLVTEHPHVQRALQFVQLGVALKVQTGSRGRCILRPHQFIQLGAALKVQTGSRGRCILRSYQFIQLGAALKDKGKGSWFAS